ncbi:MAG TPA: hypothetical protein PKD79_03300 [Candidatus Doudnabacteria bacterium]|nr:hypothetical protein [Candidatus Doudnabacteria bacterium]
MQEASNDTTVFTPNRQQFLRIARLFWLSAGVVFIITLVVILFKIFSSSEVVALRYNIIIGVSEIGNRFQLLQLPLAGLLISGVNFALTKFNKSNQRILPLLASTITLAVNLILLFAALLLFRVN